MTDRKLIVFRLAVVFLITPPPVFADSRPNVLFVIADDLNCAVGPYGDQTAITPNLNRLAKRSLVFERAYCQQAVCNPSRSSFLTGLSPDTVGVDDLRLGFRETAPNGSSLTTLPEHFRNHGYFCQNIGKIFHNMGETQDRRSWSVDESFFKGTHAADTVHTNTPAHLQKSSFTKAPVTESLDVPDIAYRDGQIANLAASMLRDYPSDSRPFFLAVGFWRPYLPFVAPKKYWSQYNPATIPAPLPQVPPVGVPQIALHESREVKGYGGMSRERAITSDEVRHLRHGYYASITFLDAQLGKILDALEAAGHSENTIIVFTSDHGFHIGEHGLWGKTTNFELDARVPLLISSPRHPASHGKRTKSLAELLDLYPTLAELAEITEDLPENLEGTSQVAVVADPKISVRPTAMTRHQHPFYGSRKNWKAWGRSVRTDRWRYTEWRDIGSEQIVAQELYDHENDPLESVNVLEKYPDVARREAARLRRLTPVRN